MPLPTGQLTRHDSATQNKSITYSYDEAGNLLTKRTYAYTTGTLGSSIDFVTYAYSTGTWGDLLTAYDGKAITYDDMGNMETFDGATFTWQGRQLSSRAKNGTTTTYTYNSDGIRTSKTVGSTKTEYFLNGNQILAQKAGDNVMWFFYDANGTRVALISGGYMFYYLYNLQGDVIALVRAATGQIVAKYSYDAWGNCTTTNLDGWTVGTRNPFRYRGYYYDSESGLYYLNSRYYDPELGRFISPDTTAILTATPTALTDKNLYAYCDNNPVMRADNSGELWTTVGIMAVGGVLGAGISAISSAVTQKSLTGTINFKSVGVAAATGFVSGAVAASPLNITGQRVVGGIIGGLSYVADSCVNDRPVKLDEALLSVGMGLVSGQIGGSGANENMALTSVANYTRQIIGREARRANQQYAQKVINSAISYRNNTFANATWSASFRFSVGTGVSNGVSIKYSSYGWFPNAPSWKPW